MAAAEKIRAAIIPQIRLSNSISRIKRGTAPTRNRVRLFGWPRVLIEKKPFFSVIIIAFYAGQPAVIAKAGHPACMF
jgi:hypothetical protein